MSEEVMDLETLRIEAQHKIKGILQDLESAIGVEVDSIMLVEDYITTLGDSREKLIRRVVINLHPARRWG